MAFSSENLSRASEEYASVTALRKSSILSLRGASMRVSLSSLSALKSAELRCIISVARFENCALSISSLRTRSSSKCAIEASSALRRLSESMSAQRVCSRLWDVVVRDSCSDATSRTDAASSARTVERAFSFSRAKAVSRPLSCATCDVRRKIRTSAAPATAASSTQTIVNTVTAVLS